MLGPDEDFASAPKDPGSRSGAGSASVHRYLPDQNHGDGPASVDWEAAHHEVRAAHDALFQQVMAFRDGEASERDVLSAEMELHAKQERATRLLEELKAARR